MGIIYKNPKTFVISGDMGDVIYHLLFIKKVGGEVYHLDTTGGVNGGRGYIRNDVIACGNGNPGKFNFTKAMFLMSLLKKQSYLKEVSIYTGDPKNSWRFYNVNASEYYRDDIFIKNLTYFHAKKYELDLDDLNDPWLEVPDPIKIISERNLVINRTLRYRANDEFYKKNLEEINSKGIFVGLKEEYFNFVEQFNCKDLPYIETHTALQLAKVIAGCEKFIGNGSLAASIAIGVGLDIRYEFCEHSSNYLFERDNIRIF